MAKSEDTLRNLLDREQIRDALARYARGVDRADWDLVRSVYHPDAHDHHGDYQGGIDGLIEWLKARLADAENGMHLLANCLIEFQSPDLALVETYFVSVRLRGPDVEHQSNPAVRDAVCRQSWGRYLDRFERRGTWGIARRTVVLDSVYTTLVHKTARGGSPEWGHRGRGDRLYSEWLEIVGGGATAGRSVDSGDNAP